MRFNTMRPADPDEQAPSVVPRSVRQLDRHYRRRKAELAHARHDAGVGPGEASLSHADVPNAIIVRKGAITACLTQRTGTIEVLTR